MSYQMVGLSFDSVGDYFAAALCLLLLLFSAWVVYHSVYRNWHCASCGKAMRGSLDPDTGFELTNKCAACCGWHRISHSEYNRSFGISDQPHQVKPRKENGKVQ